MTALVNFQVGDDLSQRFIEAAATKQQSPDEAIKEAMALYIRRVRNEQMRDAAERIRANEEDEADVMRWIEAHSVSLD
ncbi:hypothetical protein J2Y48_002481 [Mycoplana sp. BE70]|uniref:hypothetical protein n=1 Tax=Mycoplana sp. BE70 TaxID=2817775 RepID=UPI00285885D8|nr:hypothetical protein [Mycoplana sp. BE70]MDR6757185.1 hypothetical protein [Mycoplana sp. BE70]